MKARVRRLETAAESIAWRLDHERMQAEALHSSWVAEYYHKVGREELLRHARDLHEGEAGALEAWIKFREPEIEYVRLRMFEWVSNRHEQERYRWLHLFDESILGDEGEDVE